MANGDRYYISAAAPLPDPLRLILKDDDTFGVYDRYGDIVPAGKHEEGLYLQGTRFLSHLELRIDGVRPLFLSSNIDENNLLLTADLTNPDIYSEGRLVLPKDSIHIMRSRTLLNQASLERIRLKSFLRERVNFVLDIIAEADFRDIFEVRGFKRKKRGELAPAAWDGEALRLAYAGLDGVRRQTVILFSRVKPLLHDQKTLRFEVRLPPGGEKDLSFRVECVLNGAPPVSIPFDGALKAARKRLSQKRAASASISSSNTQFDQSVHRAVADIEMMLTSTPEGPYPYGGIPWFCTPFGRDGIITAIECLWLNPALARGVLKYLSARQASSLDPERASEPGKIFHESRSGELAALGEVPFGLYYGSVDSTPLYLVLAGAYWRRTGDTAFIREIWPSILAALSWMKTHGDPDGDGFLEYAPHEKGLKNQGWKDSVDSVFHEDGSLAGGAIALCEVQAYMYAALKEASSLAALIENENLSAELAREALALKARFNETFWDEGLNTYVVALDGEKRPCRIVASNAGHALFAGIADEEKASGVASSLMTQAAFSGWGIRTVAAGEARYNPMSYHNGSVWPHDNALIAYGLASYGFTAEFMAVFSGIFDASRLMEFGRLPELFCGFHRREGVPPTLYPVACSPQTWASGSLLFMLQASLGLHFEALKGMVIFKKPKLPDFIDSLYLKNLKAGPDKSVDLHIMRRHGNTVAIEPLRKPDEISVLIIE